MFQQTPRVDCLHTGNRLFLVALMLIAFAPLSLATDHAALAPSEIEVTTESQRSLLGGFWKHSTSTTTTTRKLSLNEVETGTLLLRTDDPREFVEALRIDTKVDIDVTGMLARVVVVQSFSNPSEFWAEGLYAFPLPEDAAVDTLRMRIGETVIEGRIMEKEQARVAYERAKREGTRASMVEQSRPNLFKTAVANIAPRDTVNIEISYLETLRYDQGQFGLRFPLSITPRYSPTVLTAGMMASTDPIGPTTAMPPNLNSLAQIAVRLNPGFPLQVLESDSHDIAIKEENSMQFVSLRDVAVPMDRDFELNWRPVIGAEPGAAVFTEQFDGSTYTMVMFMPPQQAGVTVSMPRETVIVIDTSGSMAGASFEQARRAVNQALDLLSEQDYFNLVQFNTSHSSLFTRAQPATRRNINSARRFLRGLHAGGGTNMAPPLSVALSSDSGRELLKQVVFITDGAVDNEQELFGLIDQKLGQTRLFTVGIGAAPNSYFMRKAAQTGRGAFTYISSTQQVETHMQQLFQKLKSPVLKDINIQWPDGGADVSPVRIPDLYLTEPVIVSAKLGGSAKSIRINGVQAGKKWHRDLSLKGGLDFRGVSTLWARDKVGALMDGLSQGQPPENVRASVVPLALRHHLVTKYTSLVALDERPARPQNMKLVAGANTPQSLSGLTQLQYPATATAGPLKMMMGLLLLMLSLLIHRTGTRQ